MPTASYLIADMQIKLGDPSGIIYSSANLLNWLNEAQRDFCQTATPLRQVEATTIATGLTRFPMPADRVIIEGVFSRNQIPVKLKGISFTEYQNQVAACPGAFGKDSSVWVEADGVLCVYPAYGVRATRTILSSSPGPTTTTIFGFSTAGFKKCGRILIDNEEIEYTDTSPTSFLNCTRGVGGTTATSHNNKGGTVIYQCDLYIVYRRGPAEMTTVTATPDIQSCYHQTLELYCMYLAYTQTGEMEKASFMHQQWEQAVKAAAYITSKETLTPLEVHDLGTQLTNSLYGPR